MKKKVISSLMFLCYILSLWQPAYASSESTKTNSTTMYAKTAYINNVDNYGYNIYDDIIDENKKTKDDTELKVSVDNNSVVIMTELNGENIVIKGTAVAKSENWSYVKKKDKLNMNFLV